MKEKLISIIIPIYNSQDFLSESIQSIIDQDCDFENNIELILVNDGSIDSSEDICLKFKHSYPNNVVYIKKDNGGVSSARNVGIKNVKTKYFGFIDSDDYLSEDAISSVIDFFENEASAETAVATIKVINFGEKNAGHPLNPRFKSTRSFNVRNLTDANTYDVCPRVAPAFFKTKKVKKYRFDETVTAVYEDLKFMTNVLVDYPVLGLINKGEYYYRRFDWEDDPNLSITTGIIYDKRFYNETLIKITLEVLSLKKNSNSSLNKFINYVALYSLRWILFYNPSNPKDILTKKEFEEYKMLIKQILFDIPDFSIGTFELFNPIQKLYVFGLKYGKISSEKFHLNKNGDLLYSEFMIKNIYAKKNIVIKEQYVEEDNVFIKLLTRSIFINDLDFKVTVNNLDYKNYSIDNKICCEEKLEVGKPFEFPEITLKIPIKNRKQIVRFFKNTSYDEYQIKKINVSKDNKDFNKKYIKMDNIYLFRTSRSVTIYKKNLLNLIEIRLKLIKYKLRKIIKGK